MSKMKRKIVISVFLCFFIFANSFVAYGTQYFTDVNTDHWAKDFIEKLTVLGIVKGFDDATFRPNDPVSKTASISMIYQMLNKAGKTKNATDLVDKHKKTLESTGIHTYALWAEPAIAYALEKSIVHEDELKVFFKEGKNVNARRLDVAVFLAKAIAESDIANGSIVVLPFTDADFIPHAAGKYVAYLIEKGIINKNGDYMGRFNPNNAISRAEICTMIAKAYDFISKNDNTGNIAPIPDPNPGSVVVTPKDEIKDGSITYIDSSTKTILVKLTNGKTELFQINDDIEISLNGNKGTFSALQVNQEVMLTLKEGTKLAKINIKSFVPNMEATLNAVVPNTGFTLVVVREKTTNAVKSLKATGTTKVELNGLPASLDQLKLGDILKLQVDGQDILSIAAVSKIKTYQGILESEISSMENPVLKMKINNEVKEFPIDQNAKVTKNGYTRWLKDLKRLDAVTITTEYDKVIEIKANSVFSKVTGKIISLTMAKPSSILKVLVNSEEKTFTVGNNVSVTINNSSKSLYDLRVDQLVELELENEEVIEIEARDDLKKKQISGIISSIHTSSKTIKILYYNPTTNTAERKSIVYNYDTKITSTRAQTAIGVGALKVNDQIIVIGEELDDTFVAEKILLID
ncbi:S-layer homology domain-containing protein [Thermotalea metallivorans]|uniref:S-layer protein sap n=1 Tax=Thermotalea metallivorans TaxID=520762 RepID=A0A140L6Q5_9FIRM|nr:S-layer homology domain-containing protein [Thermotalea metallivorans]KXG76230.1 S-layer protein sap [Thermotalea metallivorans]